MGSGVEGEQKAALAQLAERSLSKRKVVGSNPTCGSLFVFVPFQSTLIKHFRITD